MISWALLLATTFAQENESSKEKETEKTAESKAVKTPTSANDFSDLIIENPVFITTVKHHLGGKEQPVYKMTVSEAITEDVSKAWTKSLQSHNKSKMEQNGDQYEIKVIELDKIDDSKLFNVYAKIEQLEHGVAIYAAYQIDDSLWVDPEKNTGISVKTKNSLLGFGNQVYLEVLEDKSKTETNLLKSIDKEINLIDKDITNDKRNIQTDSLKIFNSRIEIKENKSAYSAVSERLSEQKTKMASTTFTDKNEEKKANSQLKSIERERKGISKEIERLQNSILKYEQNIDNSYIQINQFVDKKEVLQEKMKLQQKRVDILKEEMLSYSK